jgi:hypothetical protein
MTHLESASSVLDPRSTRRRATWAALGAGILVVSIVAISGGARDRVEARRGAPERATVAGPTIARLPLAFVENQGQWETPARFVAREGAMTAGLEGDSIAIRFERRAAEDRVEGVSVRLAFEGASPRARLRGEDCMPGAFNFFQGNDPAAWRSGVPAYASVLYEDLYEGIDLRVRELEGRLEYDLLLDPGADLERVVVRCEGIDGLDLDSDGSLAMRTAVGEIRQAVPTTWHALSGGERRPVECRYRKIDETRYGFEGKDLDPALALVIDPGLEWATFLGGSLPDRAWVLAQDGAGLVTVAGATRSTDFPWTPGAYDTTYNGGAPRGDVFVARFDPGQTGSAQLLWCTYLGGSGDEWPFHVVQDAAGVVTLTGQTNSANFPVTPGAFDTTVNGAYDGFVARLDPGIAGSAQLVWSTYLGGSFNEQANGLALDASGAVTVTGWTLSASFPTTPGTAYQPTYAGGGGQLGDAFVTRLDPAQVGANQLLYSTFLGGSGDDAGYQVGLSPSGEAILAGATTSANFPATLGAFDTTYNGGGSPGDAFVARLNPSLPPSNQLVWSTFLGGSGLEDPEGVFVDGSGAVTLAGWTGSIDLPTSAGAFDATFNGGCGIPGFGATDAFVARLDPSGSALLYGTYLGGTCDEGVNGAAVDSAGVITVVGSVGSLNFPTTAGAYATAFNGGVYDAFVARLDPSRTGTSQLLYSTFLGGANGNDFADFSPVLDGTGAVTVPGFTDAFNFPVTPGAFSSTYSGAGDAFVARLSMLPTGVEKFGASTPGCAGPVAIGVASIPQVGNAGFAITCTGAPASAPGLLGVTAGALPSPLVIFGVAVWIDLTALPVLLPVSSSALGATQVALPIPPSPALAGAQAFAQFFWVGPSAPAPCPTTGTSASNALKVTIQP